MGLTYREMREMHRQGRVPVPVSRVEGGTNDTYSYS